MISEEGQILSPEEIKNLPTKFLEVKGGEL